MLKNKSIYPRAFIIPNGKIISVFVMAKALSTIRKNPLIEVGGWEWYSVPGWIIQKEFRRGLDDRINRRVIKSPKG